MGEGVIVVDTSLAIMWAVPEPYSDRALEWMRYWRSRDVTLHAPFLMAAEAANALYRAVIRGDVNLEEARSALAVVLSDSGVGLVEVTGLAERAMELARRLDRPAVYDCYFLALAEWFDCAMWTGDERFYNAVRGRTDRVRWVGEPVGA
ncbi:MAG: type II toxin-antitoxin system VapC family toxin [Gemmatimonadetes bacterium]|nr:type II toxin-antitoxin system VapC family toxin [Gemmatimonadota bacterium]